MNIHIHQDQQQRGPLPLATVHELYTRGELKESALVWHEGAPGWLPIVPFLEQHPALSEPEKSARKVPVPVPVPVAVTARPPAGKSGAGVPGETALFLRTAGITLGLALLLGVGWAAIRVYVQIPFSYLLGVGGTWLCLRVFESVSRGSGGAAYATVGLLSVVLYWGVGVFGVALWGYEARLGLISLIAFAYSMYLGVRAVS